jgi:hypothetical protein
MFCCEEDARERVCRALQAEGLQEFKFKINPPGSTIMVNSFSGDQLATK